MHSKVSQLLLQLCHAWIEWQVKVVHQRILAYLVDAWLSNDGASTITPAKWVLRVPEGEGVADYELLYYLVVQGIAAQ